MQACICTCRMSTARDRGDQADFHAAQAAADADLARIHAKQFDPSFPVLPSTSALPMAVAPIARPALQQNHLSHQSSLQQQQPASFDEPPAGDDYAAQTAAALAQNTPPPGLASGSDDCRPRSDPARGCDTPSRSRSHRSTPQPSLGHPANTGWCCRSRGPAQAVSCASPQARAPMLYDSAVARRCAYIRTAFP